MKPYPAKATRPPTCNPERTFRNGHENEVVAGRCIDSWRRIVPRSGPDNAAAGVRSGHDTGIEGFFDVDLRWKPDDLSATPNDDRPTIFAALHEIGLKLQSKKVVAEVIVIDHVERTPSDN